MKKVALLAVALSAVAGLMACNKKTPPKLDYTEKLQNGVYNPLGLPGESHVGATPTDHKYQGYQPGDGHEPKTDATQPADKPPADVKPDEKKPQDKPAPEAAPGQSGAGDSQAK